MSSVYFNLVWEKFEEGHISSWCLEEENVSKQAPEDKRSSLKRGKKYQNEVLISDVYILRKQFPLVDLTLLKVCVLP